MVAVELAERFWPKVEIPDGPDDAWEDMCWSWTGAHIPGGYGSIGVDGSQRGAHRVAYELLVGPIPDGLTIDHLCRVKDCVNPAHMEPVTSAENNRRRSATRTTCKRGHPFDQLDSNGHRQCSICRQSCPSWQTPPAEAGRGRWKEGDPVTAKR